MVNLGQIRVSQIKKNLGMNKKDFISFVKLNKISGKSFDNVNDVYDSVKSIIYKSKVNSILSGLDEVISEKKSVLKHNRDRNMVNKFIDNIIKNVNESKPKLEVVIKPINGGSRHQENFFSLELFCEFSAEKITRNVNVSAKNIVDAVLKYGLSPNNINHVYDNDNGTFYNNLKGNDLHLMIDNNFDIDNVRNDYGSIFNVHDIDSMIQHNIPSNDIRDFKMKDSNNVYFLYNLFSEKIAYNNDINSKLSCVVQYLLETLKRSKNGKDFYVTGYDNIISIDPNNNGVSPQQLYDFCCDNKLRCVIFDINGNVLYKHDPSEAKIKQNVCCIAYNGHCYGIKNKKSDVLFNMNFSQQLEFEFVNHIKPIETGSEENNDYKYTSSQEIIDSKFMELYNRSVIPCHLNVSVRNSIKDNVKTKELTITSFVDKNGLNFVNDEYDMMSTIYSKLGISEALKYNTNSTTCSKDLIKLYSKINSVNNQALSFFPYAYKDHILHYSKTCSPSTVSQLTFIDFNKYYSQCLYKLSELIYVNAAMTKISKYNDEKIESHYLYIAERLSDSFYSRCLMPGKNIYSGQHILRCKEEGIEVKIHEYIVCQKVDNFFSSMISDLYMKFSDIVCDDKVVLVKKIVNSMIGSFKKDIKIEAYNKCVNVIGDEELSCSECDYIKYRDNINFVFEKSEDKVNNIENHKPINIQIKNESLYHMYKFIKVNNISENDVFYMNTDSIGFRNNGKIYKDEVHDEKFLGYKVISSKCYDRTRTIKLNTENYDVSFFKYCDIVNHINDNKNFFSIKYAGAGKSNSIMKNVDNGRYGDNYIILNPSHSTNSEYKRKKYNACVYQKFTLQEENNNLINMNKEERREATLDKYEHIVCDEIGMYDSKIIMMLIKYILLGKTVHVYGDTLQLLPVNHVHSLNNMFFDNLFKYHDKSPYYNFRNNFKTEFYQDIINAKVSARDIVNQYFTHDINDCDIFIAYRNITVHKYNVMKTKMIRQKNIDNGVNQYIGNRIICECNDFAKMGLYNNTLLVIDDINDESVFLRFLDDDGSGEKFEFKRSLLSNCIDNIDVLKEKAKFNLAYSVNLYTVQGRSISDKMYFCLEDLYFLTKGMSCGNRELYTLVSRIKNRTDYSGVDDIRDDGYGED